MKLIHERVGCAIESCCVPYAIADNANCSRGSRIGGRAPHDISPKKITSKTKYFATFQICSNPIRELTLFTHFDFHDFIANYRDVFNTSEFVEVIVHDESERGAETLLASSLSEHSIAYGAPAYDWIPGWDEGGSEPDHIGKLGGRPHLLPNGYWDLREAVDQLEGKGPRQVVQIAFPSAGDANISGEWPFCTGLFHLFGDESLNDAKWHYFWQM